MCSWEGQLQATRLQPDSYFVQAGLNLFSLLLCQDCNLYQLIKDRDKYFPESRIRNWCYQILQARWGSAGLRSALGGGGLRWQGSKRQRPWHSCHNGSVVTAASWAAAQRGSLRGWLSAQCTERGRMELTEA